MNSKCLCSANFTSLTLYSCKSETAHGGIGFSENPETLNLLCGDRPENNQLHNVKQIQSKLSQRETFLTVLFDKRYKFYLGVGMNIFDAEFCQARFSDHRFISPASSRCVRTLLHYFIRDDEFELCFWRRHELHK